MSRNPNYGRRRKILHIICAFVRGVFGAESTLVRAGHQRYSIGAVDHDSLRYGVAWDVIDRRRRDRSDVEVALAIRFDAVRS